MTLDLLRFTTAGSVDDGKSTLIGRLLYDTRSLLDDQVEQVMEASRRRNGDGVLDLALLTDGLRAEREQGITIDVAYRYFGTTKRRFIIADVPGHQQYTRNMVTGASTADLAIVLVDAAAGVVEQSKRHAFISTLLRIPHVVIAINKMDLVDYAQERFEAIRADVESFRRNLPDATFTYIPMSALNGDNVVERSSKMPWYDGMPLLEFLETVEIGDGFRDVVGARFPVQWVVRAAAATGGNVGADDIPNYRGYAGQVAGGTLRSGDDVVVLPSGHRTRVAAIDTYDGPLETAPAPLSVTIRLADDVDVSRGDVLCAVGDAPSVGRDVEAEICWMSERPLRANSRYIVKHLTRTAPAIVTDLLDIVDVHTLDRRGDASEFQLNDIGRVALRSSTPLVFDSYAVNRHTGSFILIDETSNETVGAGMILGPGAS